MTKKGKAKPTVELEEEPNFNCKSYDQWQENDDEDTFWNCTKRLVPKGADCCPANCPGFELKKEADRDG